MLKFIFWSLLFANIGLFAYQRGYLDAWIPNGHEPARVSHQFHAELMKPMSATALASLPSTDGTGAVPTAAATAKPDASVCKEIGSFDSAAAKRFETLLQPLALGDKVTRKDSEEVANHIVYIPSQGSKEGADKKALELRHLGVTDFYIIQDAGEFHWGISLGVFKTEEAARAQLSALNQKGVHSARLGTHSVAATKVVFQLQGLDSASLAGVEKISADFPHIETRSCDADVSAGTKTADPKTAAAHSAKQGYAREVIH